jgi:hypothetical protein
MTLIAIMTLFTGTLLLLLSLPLIGRKIPMNGAYGIRIPAAFESEQRWYDINAYGGRQMAVGAAVIMAGGIAGFFLPPERQEAYMLGSVALTVLSVLIPALNTMRWSRKNR